MSVEKMKNPILDHISSLLCINCSSNEWKVESERVICKSCGHNYPILDNGKLVTVQKYISEDNYDDFINMDLGNYEPVHIVADLAKTPLVNGSVELVVSNSVIEHIYDYQAVMDEVSRILKSGGYFYLCVPNACLRHHKYDYHRWTTPGLHKLFDKRFEIIDSGACRGIAYALITYVEALLAYKIKNTNILSASRWIWRLISRPLFWMREESNEEYQAMSQTIYVLGKKL